MSDVTEEMRYTPPTRTVDDGNRSNTLTLAFIKMLMGALTARSMEWLTLAGAIGVWGYSMVHPEPFRLIAAAGYSVAIYLPMLLKKR